ncbi:hypothetical protein GCM10009809_25660 [Isoptericola hypogeus]|uniref:GGDEF domain-containing protein n=1 Tax=Isoptericola hypogeus TaxID=300179 RepID=A0ABN2JIY6_9MICO
MSPTPSGPASEHGTDVRARWRAASLAEVWLRPGDWYHPAIDAVAEAIEEDRSPDAAAHRLGVARGCAGIGLEETLDDVACAFRAAGLDPDLGSVRAVAVGWVHGRERTAVLAGVRDPGTGLPTQDYLGERLRETYGAAVSAATSVPATHCLLVVDVAVDGLDPWQRAGRSAAVGQALENVFGEGYPMAALSDGVFAVLCERTDTVADVAVATRRIVERNAEVLGLGDTLRRPTRVWIERLPATHLGAVELLRHLGR